MTRNEKKTAIENMAERFMSISDLEGKSMAIMVMSAYAEGKAAGKVEERRRWEQKEAVPSLERLEALRRGMNLMRLCLMTELFQLH